MPTATRALWLLGPALAIACGGAPTREPLVGNVARGCKAMVYEAEPVQAAMLVVGAQVVWFDGNKIKSVHVDGGDVTSFESAESLDVHQAIAVGADVFVSDPEHDAVWRVSLADRTVTKLVGDVRNPYELAYAGGSLFIGAEDELYRFDVAREELTELGRNAADRLAAFGEVAYAALADQQLVALDGRTGKMTVLVESLASVDGSAVEPIGFAATARGPVWSTARGAIWTHDVPRGRNRKLAQLEHPAFQILPVGGDLYFAVGPGVQRLRGDRPEAIPIDRSRWDDDPRIRVTQIGVHADTLVYYAPFTAFASACL